MAEKTLYFDKNTTNILKGVMLIFMFTHHLFTFPKWYVEGISYPELLEFARVFNVPFRICVPTFAFLTGYFYWATPNKSIAYSIQKIKGICKDYWGVYFAVLIIAVILGYKDSITLGGVFLEAIGLRTPFMSFSWYVCFYVIAMMYMPLFARLCKESIWRIALFGVAIPYAIGWGTAKSSLEIGYLSNILNIMQINFPYMAIGYGCSLLNSFQRARTFDDIIVRSPSRHNIVWLVIAGSCFIGQHLLNDIHLPIFGVWRLLYLICVLFLNYVSIPLFVYCLANIIKENKHGRILSEILSAFGKQSMTMWFIHGVFFGTMKNTLQPILYAPKYPVLVLVWGLSICYLISIIYKRLGIVTHLK